MDGGGPTAIAAPLLEVPARNYLRRRLDAADIQRTTV